MDPKPQSLSSFRGSFFDRPKKRSKPSNKSPDIYQAQPTHLETPKLLLPSFLFMPSLTRFPRELSRSSAFPSCPRNLSTNPSQLFTFVKNDRRCRESPFL
ncbi:hypothetical protein Droror1_Dr00010867 [Drosera rotundifolia]